MKFTLTQNHLAIMQEKNKLYSYLSASFTKTYFAVGEGKFEIFFRGPKGAIKTTVVIDEAASKMEYFQIDYNKWLTAISKMFFADKILFDLTDRSLKISTEGSTDTIALGVTTFESGSSEAIIFKTFCEEGLKKTSAHTFECTKEIADAFIVTNAMFSAAGRNNAVAVSDAGVMYADRSIVLKVNMPSTGICGSVNLHKFTSGFMLQAMKFDPMFSFSREYDTLAWKDENTTVILASEDCEIAIPTEEEAKQIVPKAETSSIVSYSSHELFAGLDFFSGFYEASAWKPITFRIGDAGTVLHYKHPTTEISKQISTEPLMKGEFTIVSEMLGRLLAKSIDISQDALQVSFTYDNDAPGVGCRIGDLYDVIFAKLTE